MKNWVLLAFLGIMSGIPNAGYAKCGGGFDAFIRALKRDLIAHGAKPANAARFLETAAYDERVLKRDRSQSVFRQNFSKFAKRVVSQSRLDIAQKKARAHRESFLAAEAQYGVPAPVLLAFWAMETDYGVNQGDFNTLNALVTLAHDCRRPKLFRPQIMAAYHLWERGDFDPATTEGAWAGEIGMLQMLPQDILNLGIDADQDGRVNLSGSEPDAILSAAHVLKAHGWRAGPWMAEVTLSRELDWAKTGLNFAQPLSSWQAAGVRLRDDQAVSANARASLILPEGRNGPAFLIFENFKVYFKWNKSLVNVMTAAYFATRINGSAPFLEGNPSASLSDDMMKTLQKKLQLRGHDVGKIDGILGAKTRAAVQREQRRLGLPADAWPTRELLSRL